MSSFLFIRKYLKHQFLGQNQYRIHSPWVYEFYQRVLKGSEKESFFESIETIRKELLRNRKTISIQDLGAGTGNQGPVSNQREVRDIALKALKPPYLARILGRMAKFIQARSIIELGTSLGITSSYLAFYCPDSQVFTLEGSPEIAQIAKENFERLSLKNIKQIQGNFDETLPELLSENPESPRFIYIDGNHRYEPTLRYFNDFLIKGNQKDVLVFDDIHWSLEMEKAWKAIRENDKVFLSLDLFYFGIVFLREDRAKEHFRIRLF